MSALITCSSLTRNCRWWKTLEKLRDKPPSVAEAADEGTRAGKLIQDWLEGREPAEPEVIDDPWRWYQNMRAGWKPPAGVICEAPLGLDYDGRYVPVEETEPHVYTSLDPTARLLTAGRADLLWFAAGTIVVADIKRSAWRYSPPERHPQLMALGLAAAARGSYRWLQLALYDLRDAAWEATGRIDLEEEGEAMLEEVREMATMTDDPQPGPWCGGCWERRACKAAWSEEQLSEENSR